MSETHEGDWLSVLISEVHEQAQALHEDDSFGETLADCYSGAIDNVVDDRSVHAGVP